MVTVEEVNNTFAEKGLYIALPLPSDWLVKNLQILDKRNYPGGVAVLLSVTYINDQGKEISDLFQTDTQVDRRLKKESRGIIPTKSLPKNDLLPLREIPSFENEEDAEGYLEEAISHLLQDKGYHPKEQAGADLCFQKEAQLFSIDIAVRCDEIAYEKAQKLIQLRYEYGSEHEYGLVIPAFQDSLGISLIQQERWISKNEEYLSTHHIGVYAVDNLNPNQIYAFTVYPKAKEFRRYFMITSGQWTSVRDRYVASRGKKGSL